MSFYDIRDEKIFISAIQRMLRDINYLNLDDGGVGISGIYDPATKEYVRAFQRDMDLKPTGTVDLETWEILRSVHKSTLEERSSPRAVKLFYPHSPVNFLPNEKNDLLYIIQMMLKETGYFLEDDRNILLTGVYDEQTLDAINEFKRRNLLDGDGVIDTATLNKLFDEYEGLNLSEQ